MPEPRAAAEPASDQFDSEMPWQHAASRYLSSATRAVESDRVADAPRDALRAGTSPVGLPMRVPSPPDVPDVPGDPGQPRGEIDESAESPDLDRIANFLSQPHDERPVDDGPVEGFDIPAVIEAVRGVCGVRDAQLRPNPSGVHRLCLELADDADPAEVSRVVARLLKERMGLATEGHPDPAGPPAPVAQRPSTLPQLPSAASVMPPPPGMPQPPATPPLGQARLVAPYASQARRRRYADGPQRPASATPPAAMGVPGGGVPNQHALPSAAGDASTGSRSGTPRLAGGRVAGPLVAIDQVKVTDEGNDALVEVRLSAGDRPALGVANGPAFDGYVLRLAAVAAAAAIDHLLHGAGASRGRCFIEHAAVISLGGCDVAVVVVLFAGEGWVDQLSGSAVVTGDPRHAVVRATLAAVDRHLDTLLR